MFELLQRLFLGPLTMTADLKPDVCELAWPGRPPAWDPAGQKKVRLVKGKAGFPKPFFNHDAGHTRRPHSV